MLERLETAFMYHLPRLKVSCIEYLVKFGKVLDIIEEFKGFIRSTHKELLSEVVDEIFLGKHINKEKRKRKEKDNTSLQNMVDKRLTLSAFTIRRPPLRLLGLPDDPVLYNACKEPCEHNAEHGDANSLVLIEILKR
ncbi:hypothetical protein Tco_0818483 [Tanacetum coccineum]